jgi:hypothetical protein
MEKRRDTYNVLMGKQNVREPLVDVGMGGRMILKHIFKK